MERAAEVALVVWVRGGRGAGGVGRLGVFNSIGTHFIESAHPRSHGGRRDGYALGGLFSGQRFKLIPGFGVPLGTVLSSSEFSA